MDMNNDKLPFQAVSNCKPPYLGVAYYPEDWEESEADYDIFMMQKAGINMVRIGEFAWYKMEPKPGQYHFEWLHRMIDKLKNAGIGVILGTPTATPPHHLLKQHPDMAVTQDNDRSASHGGRRHCCSNNPNYQKACTDIVTAMAREFADDENVYGWQIDNEIYPYGQGCFCPHCLEQFHRYLHERFGTVEELNQRWNLNLFSQAYDSLEDVVPPRDTWHNPHLKSEWFAFQAQRHICFVQMQADILHRYVHVPVGTDMMPTQGIDHRRMTASLDIVQFNHYNEPDNLYTAALWFDYLRTLKKRPFWVTETQTCWNGSTVIRQSIKPEGFCRLNSFLPLALGGEANMYWLWRTHWAGHELMHGSVLDTSGRPQHIFGEVQQTAEIFKKAGQFLHNTHVETKVALHYDAHNRNMMKEQPIVPDMEQEKVFDYYSALVALGIRPDVIDSEEPLEKYSMLVSPLMMTLERAGLNARIMDWVKNGGTWVVGPFTDIRNFDGARFQHKPFGILEELTGAEWIYGIPDAVGAVSSEWKDGKPFHGQYWYDVFEDNGHALVQITKGHSALIGKATILDIPVEKGHVLILGTLPGAEELSALLKIACEHAKIPCGMVEGKVMVAPRVGNAENGVVLCEYGNEPATYHFNGTLTDILTGKVYTNSICLEPYGIAVLCSMTE